MTEISNRTLAVLLFIAIIVSVGGAMINISQLAELTRVIPSLQITGYPTVGTVNITVQAQAQINLSDYQVDFGPGFVLTGGSARLNTSSSGVLGRENWSNATTFAPTNITLENTGNQNISLNFTSDKNGTEFISNNVTTTPLALFQFRGVNKEAGTCNSTTNLTTSYTAISDPVAADDSNTVQNDLCKCMRFEAANDEIYMNVQVLIPETAPTGAKNATLTFTATGFSKSCW